MKRDAIIKRLEQRLRQLSTGNLEQVQIVLNACQVATDEQFADLERLAAEHPGDVAVIVDFARTILTPTLHKRTN